MKLCAGVASIVCSLKCVTAIFVFLPDGYSTFFGGGLFLLCCWLALLCVGQCGLFRLRIEVRRGVVPLHFVLYDRFLRSRVAGDVVGLVGWGLQHF